MDLLELAGLIEEHWAYCIKEYQPGTGSIKDTDFMEKMGQSLTHFAMWLRTVKNK